MKHAGKIRYLETLAKVGEYFKFKPKYTLITNNGVFLFQKTHEYYFKSMDMQSDIIPHRLWNWTYASDFSDVYLIG